MENKTKYNVPVAIIISAVIIASAIAYTPKGGKSVVTLQKVDETSLEELVLPSAGVVLPIEWDDLGAKLVSVGAIDADKLRAIYLGRGGFSNEFEVLLSGKSMGNLKIDSTNAPYLLNLFWALGLASKNPILDDGEMMDPDYGGAGNFASTGGWTLANGDAMDHYSMHKFFNLSGEQQALVEKISSGIYRPCCNNSVHFPDCNHGMAMLGLLELMASQGASEDEMWDTALVVNSYWFPSVYLTIAEYKQERGTAWGDVKPEDVLGLEYSSSSGFRNISSQSRVPTDGQGGGGCGVGAGVAPTLVPRQQSGCGV